MGVYIKGLKMPKEGFVEVLIRDDGTVQQTGQSYRLDGTDYYTPYVGEMPVVYKAVPVPPHGRLIDADALKEAFCDNCFADEKPMECPEPCIDMRILLEAPTIIPTEPPKEES